MNVIKDENSLPILNWAKNIEDSALEQAKNLAKHPCVVSRVCLAPDAHCGYGMPIGGIIAVESALIPNAVGVDIGCSMSACRTNILADDISIEQLKKIVGGSKEYKGGIRANIPVGMSHHNKKQDHKIFADRERWNNTVVCKDELESAQYQLGTMGGGNHFIELQKGSDGYLWYMIHSGSRNLGYKVGNFYNKVAEELCTKFHREDVVKNKLAFLPRGTKVFDQYLNEMNLCLDFASANHYRMIEILEGIIKYVIPECSFVEHYYTRHNYAALEHHDNRDLFIHRKGAIRARLGDKAIIPGSQGTASYIVEGLGNPKSFCSASHGSGRVMSRTRAQAELSLKDEQEKMKNIIHNMTSEKQLDEAPSAYKDIDEVIKLEADLVKPIIKLVPLAVVKG